MSNLYESNRILSEYLLFHYGTADQILPAGPVCPPGMREALDFAVRTTRHFSKGTVKRGLDLGCAVGRSAFEMARHCDEVVGIDFSHAFVRAAESLRLGETLDLERCEEASLRTTLQVRIPEQVDGTKLKFFQGDAMGLSAELGGFDRVHAANLVCRLTHPKRLLDRLPSLVNPGGELLLATPCTWLEEFTPSENWPGKPTFDWLKDLLSGDFILLRSQDEPFLIRETARKFQWTSSLVTVWRRHE